MTIDTACSSSLVALHQAVNDLRNGSSKVSVVAGTNLLLDPLPYISESNLNMLSPTGRSRMWDAGADGYARGDGVAAVILKTLSQAIRDGDQIDCIIRETGANQDGRTSGITMPSGMAQAALIRDTYNRAGLNPLKPLERCQYFEAHGTGTPAGDPQEASALAAAFFDDEERDDILYVGSVKTVIGHTEGTAGLAGVLKAYNAIKNKTIPPNLLFNELSPAVEPYYKHLQILNDAIPWPELPAGVPRRASVNSFGFGGSNAHAILESYEKKVEGNNTSLSLLPFVFSANSETSLQALLESYAEYIKANPSLNMDSLRYTLANKRSALSHRTFFVADSAESLASQLESRLRVCREEKEPIGLKPQGTPEIIAIFTGQGAQWAGMGREFVQTFPPARQLIKNLDDSLATLPESDRPNWSIFTELTEPTTPNQINEASLSQPLCTALQIVLVDLLRSTGTEFKAVVGHSSGEIAAAFAAGFISASDAIRIAYYRGLHVKLAHGVAGEKGTMMAVGTSFEDAKEVCELEDFEDRIHVAAVNSSSSVTLSGDEEVLKQAQEVFQNEKKFARMLKVDTAYHSHHMLPCAVPYEKSLRACNIQVLTPTKNAPVWISSVRESEDMGVTKDLEAQYWVDNMTSPVLFHQALEHTLKTKGTFTLGLEIGPHPALQGPAMQTMQETVDDVIPYAGTFYRSKANDVAVADALGASWTGPGSTGSNWIQFVEKCWGDTKTIPVLKDLPTYPWDHSRLFRSESRYAKHLRTQESRVHPLLGQKTADGTGESIIRWKNILKPKELQWLSGHALQGQLVFPGTGYIALAMEAAMEIAAGRPVESIELLDLAITRAIAIDELLGTEIVVAMTELSGHLEKDPGVITGHFTSFSSISRESPDLQVNAFGNVRINMGTFTAGALLPREDRDLEMTPVDVDDFYSAMEDLGYGYAGEFKALSKIERRLGFAKGTISRPPMDKDERPLLFHPGMLDTALQTLFAAFSAPGDERLWALHAPSGIRRVTLVPSLCGRSFPEQVEFDSMITAARPNHITGDVDLISADGIHKCIEIDGLGFVPFTAATESDDRTLFSKVTWGLEEPDGALALGRSDAADAENLKALERERVAFFYLRKIFENRPSSVEDYQEALLEFAQHVQDQVRKGKHPYATKEWLSDTREQILELIKKCGSLSTCTSDLLLTMNP
jgi:acyl transferase domain-containing protein